MKKFRIVTTNGFIISIIAEDFDRDLQLGRLAFRVGNSNVAMFELSNIVGFYNAAQEDK